MTVEGEDGDRLRKPAGPERPDEDPTAEPEELWQKWVTTSPTFDRILDRRVQSVERLALVLFAASAAVFVVAVVAELTPGVGILLVLGGFGASTALVAAGDHNRYLTAWRRRTGSFDREEILAKGTSLDVAAQVYLRDSARAIAGQERAFRHLLVGLGVAACCWVVALAVLFS